MSTATNVSAGKPKVAGAIYAAPIGTTLPTNTEESLDAAFKELGFCSEDGLTNSTDLETEEIKAWGGATVLTIQTSKTDTFKFTLIETLNEEVMKFVYGSSNVTGSLSTGLKVVNNNEDVEEKCLVIDMILRGNTARRIVIPDCKISDLGDINYTDSDVIGYETTLACMPDSDGNNHYEYTLKPAISG